MKIEEFITSAIQQHRSVGKRADAGFETPDVSRLVPDVSAIAFNPSRNDDKLLADWILTSLKNAGVELPDEVEI